MRPRTAPHRAVDRALQKLTVLEMVPLLGFCYGGLGLLPYVAHQPLPLLLLIVPLDHVERALGFLESAQLLQVHMQQFFLLLGTTLAPQTAVRAAATPHATALSVFLRPLRHR